MMHIFEQTDTETDCYPRHDPAVIQRQAALEDARCAHAPAHTAWGEYCAAHYEDVTRVPFPRDKQRLYDHLQDTSEAVEVAETNLHLAMGKATAKATEAWDDRIRQAFLADQSLIEQFITVLERHEQTAIEAELAGVSHALSVSKNFLTSTEVAERLAYAKKALGIE